MAIHKQTVEELERGYDKEDPWGYKLSVPDAYRKFRILQELYRTHTKPFERALDIACGEAWITRELPAFQKHGIELSQQARARFPTSVVPVEEPDGMYDLIVCTGALYEHYNWERFITIINKHAIGTVLTCNIQDWEVTAAIEKIRWGKVLDTTFPYRRPEGNYTQRLRMFKV